MESAVERIKRAAIRNEPVLVHGDYDTDGLTSTAIAVHVLASLGIDVHYFIPNRTVHGYGFNEPSVGIAKELGAKLIITVDCGISSYEAAASARKEGIDVIITDHHEPLKAGNPPLRHGHSGSRSKETQDPLLPDAIAVINPKLLSHNSSLSNLSGAGVAFKLAQALAEDSELPLTVDDTLTLLDLAALGTLADVVPLTGENRMILKEGLTRIHNGHRPGVRSLMEVSGLRGREPRAGLLSFTLVPRINAAGRIDDPRDVVKLFLSPSDEETRSIAERLNRINAERQRIEEEVYQDALCRIHRKGFDAAIVLHSEGWHTGVVGIVAARIAEEFCRPAFVFTITDTIAKGSVRSIPGFDVCMGLSACADLLVNFGGHKQAAGVTLHASLLPAFEERINQVVKDFLEGEGGVPPIVIDAEVSLSEVTGSLIRELSRLEPFGYGNPEPLFGARNLDVLNPRIVGNNHVKMRVRQKSSVLEAIGFDLGRFFEDISSSSIDAVFTASINEWNGSRSVQLTLKAFRESM